MFAELEPWKQLGYLSFTGYTSLPLEAFLTWSHSSGLPRWPLSMEVANSGLIWLRKVIWTTSPTWARSVGPGPTQSQLLGHFCDGSAGLWPPREPVSARSLCVCCRGDD